MDTIYSLLWKSLLGSGVLLYIYFWIGRRWEVYDVPNERSSHGHVVIRGGGIVLFVLNIFWGYWVGDMTHILLAASLSLGVITGFVDDYKSLHTGIRFILYFIAIALILFGVLELHRFDTWIWAPLLVILLGAVNTYNFMDGINGITALYSIILLGSSVVLLHHFDAAQFDAPILSYLGFFLAFCFFNLRINAKLFLGDAGSVSMGLLAAFLVVFIGIKIGSWTSITLLAAYGVDSVGTIVLRLIKRENILQAHRSHLYQDLVHKKCWNHLAVSGLYAGVQLAINVGFIGLIDTTWGVVYSLGIFIVLTLVYLLIKLKLHGNELFIPSK